MLIGSPAPFSETRRGEDRALKNALGTSPLLGGEQGLRPFSPHPFLRGGRSASLRYDAAERFRLTKSIPPPQNRTSQRRCAPMMIAEAEIVDRFQIKSVIAFLKIRIRRHRLSFSVMDWTVEAPHEGLRIFVPRRQESFNNSGPSDPPRYGKLRVGWLYHPRRRTIALPSSANWNW